MTQLAQEVGDSRLDVSRVLNAIQSEGLLRLRRGIIEISSLELLLM
jgi:DNA-binding GntR family transcriptional regulator